jgi:hypothetical protein
MGPLFTLDDELYSNIPNCSRLGYCVSSCILGVYFCQTLCKQCFVLTGYLLQTDCM